MLSYVELLRYLFYGLYGKLVRLNVLNFICFNEENYVGYLMNFLRKNPGFKIKKEKFLVVKDFNILSLLVKKDIVQNYLFVIDNYKNIFIERKFLLDNINNVYVEDLYNSNRLKFVYNIFLKDINLLDEYLNKISTSNYIDVLFMVFDIEGLIADKDRKMVDIIKKILSCRDLINWYNIDERNLGDNFIRVFKNFINLNLFIKDMKISENLMLQLVEEGLINLSMVIKYYDYISLDFINKIKGRLNKEDLIMIESRRGIKL